MKVLVIPTWYPNGEDKLMGIYHKEFTSALNSYGIEANMLYIDRQRLNNPIKYLFMKKKLIDQELNYKVYIYRMLNISRISFDLQMKNYVKKIKKAYLEYIKINGKPDVIHAHVTVPAGYAAAVLGQIHNIPVIVTEHCGNLERFFNSKNLSKYGKYVLENTTYSTVSNYMKKIVLKYKNKCYIIPNLVDTTTFNNNVKRKLNKQFKLISICALREGKRIDIAIKAIKILVDKGYDVHLDIIGDGFYEQQFKNCQKELKMEKYVTFLGRKNKLEIAEILKKEHALLISSELESFGIMGIEALTAGIPIISTKCLGPEEYIDSKSGVLCKVNDPEDMAKSILKLYNNYSKYDSAYLKKVALRYSRDEVIKNTVKLYKQAIKKNI